ncbi:MAG: hypothetical protein V7603_2213 [Micromonosporaceae bacterium]
MLVSVEDGAVTVAGRTIAAAGDPAVLARALYHAWHTGLPPDGPRRLPGPPDPAFTQRLTAGVAHRVTPTPAQPEPSVAVPRPGTAIVRVGGVLVRVPAGAVLDAATVAVPAVRPALYPGYVVVDGSRGHPAGPVLRLYLHVADACRAPAVVRELVAAMEERSLAYRMKICADPESFPRRDALVAYLPPDAWRRVGDLAAGAAGALGAAGCLRPETSLFAERLAPGISVAWEPVDNRPGMAGLSFGIHRALAVAHGVLAHARAATTGAPASREDAVVAALRTASIDPAAPFRNLDTGTT